MDRLDACNVHRSRRLAITIAVAITIGTIGGASCSRSADPADAAAQPQPAFIPADASWLASVNYYRAMAGLAPVTEDPSLAAGATAHSCYMLANGISHDEVAGRTGYSSAGHESGQSSNVAVTDAVATTSRRFVEIWMTGPFHALGVLRPQLQQVGFGRCDRSDTPKWRSAATLDILHGLGSSSPRTAPIVFPGDGTTTSLDHFIAETPNPLTFCGWTGEAGLPVLALLPEGIQGAVGSAMTGPGGPIETCVLTEQNTTGAAQSLLAFDHVVVVVPRTPLVPGVHSVSVDTATRTVAWSFTVDPAAATVAGSSAPAQNAIPAAVPAGLQPLEPARVVDGRDSFGASTLVAGGQQRVQIAGVAGVSPAATGVSLNLTATGAGAAGYVTLWDCSPQRPVVATINFQQGQTVANAALVGLDGSGALCVFANTGVDIVVDVNGYLAPGAAGHLTPLTPRRLLDTRAAGSSGRLAAGGNVSVAIAEPAAAAVLTVTAVGPDADGFVTVWPCDRPRPLAAGLNPARVRVAGSNPATSNMVVAPVGSDGSVCLYTSTGADLVVDMVAVVGTGSSVEFTSTLPFRLVDTREVDRPQLNGGVGGPLAAGQTMVVPIAGSRSIAADARAVAVNIAVVGANAPGYLTAFPCGLRPATSNVNYGTGAATSTASLASLSAGGELCIYSQQAVHVIVDVTGWWS